ncbi:MAG TPA: LLM class flavin-dependent oxidoreductase, partial [Ktedonobacteraceae bacterium]|nr:LLM class flavin-dependent oxidoreductase [Ktedonobacteraceae bacterium]
MQQNNTEAGTAQERQARERIGLAVFGPDAATVVSTIVAAEEAGVRQIWMTQSGLAADTLTIFAA